MLKRNIIMFVMLIVVVGPCFAAVRGSGPNRRSSRTSFVSAQARVAQVADSKNDLIAVQTTDSYDTPSDVPDGGSADITIKQPAPALDKEEPLFTDAEISEIISSLNDIVAALKSEINTLENEIIRCEQEKKTSTILTVVGAAGTLGTGIGAIIQGKKLHDAKKEGAVEKQENQEASE